MNIAAQFQNVPILFNKRRSESSLERVTTVVILSVEVARLQSMHKTGHRRGHLRIEGPRLSTENKLYIFVRAEIICPEDTLAAIQDKFKRISGQNRAAFEQYEKEFQDYQDWPAVPPKPMAPERVLDTQ